MLIDAELDVGEPALSPEGRWLACYESHERGTPTIAVVPFPNIHDGRWSVSGGGGPNVQPVWSPNGRELFFRGGPGLMVAQVETSRPSVRTGHPNRSLSGAATRYQAALATHDCGTSRQTGTACSSEPQPRRLPATRPSTV